jgi:Mce-associated membrane protein
MSETATDSAEALRLAELAEAEAAEAEAAAAAARARAQQLRDHRNTPDAATDQPEDTPDEDEARPPRRWITAAGVRTVAESAAGIVVLALIAAGAFFLYEGRMMDRHLQQQSEFAVAAQQGVVNLMSLDFNNAQSDIQRVIDSTTGEFHDDFASSTGDFLTVMKESQVVTTATVNATAVETMSDDSAIVLVAATSQVANSVSKQPNPRIWRLSVTVTRVGDQIKMSKVEFVP